MALENKLPEGRMNFASGTGTKLIRENAYQNQEARDVQVAAGVGTGQSTGGPTIP